MKIYNLGGSTLLRNLAKIHPSASVMCRALEKKELISDERFFLLDTVFIKVFYCDMIILLNQFGVKGLEMMS